MTKQTITRKQGNRYLLILVPIMGFIVFILTLVEKDMMFHGSYQYVAYQDSINIVVENVAKYNHGWTSILSVADDSIMTSGNNYDYEESSFGLFLKPNDSIVKGSYSDTLFVYREKERFYFINYGYREYPQPIDDYPKSDKH